MKKWIIVSLVVLVLVFAVLGFSGIKPFSTVVDNTVDWWRDTLGTNTPSGTYSADYLGSTITMIFTDDELVIDAYRIAGVFTYQFSDNNTITVTDVFSGETEVWDFRYIKEEDIVVLDGRSYYKEP